MFYNLEFFKESRTGICGEDFKKKFAVIINLTFIVSISDLEKFDLPMSGKFVGYFAKVTMINDDQYYIHSDSFGKLKEKINL